MNSLTANLRSWSAWAPGLDTATQWQRWAKGELSIAAEGAPPVNFLPSMFRRRLSRLSKMALHVAFNCPYLEPGVRTVFCSRHGELKRTVELLNTLTHNELLSPTTFSMCVHNTASGLFSIAHKNTSPSTTIAAGADTIESAFLDAATTLQSNQAKKIMLVIADEPIPVPLLDGIEDTTPPFAAAFLLCADKNGPALSLHIDNEVNMVNSTEPHALALLRFIINRENQLRLTSKRFTWVWGSYAN